MRHGLFLILFFVSATFISNAQTSGPEIKFDNIEHNYGEIKENDGVANHTFWFTNTGDQDLLITRVQPGCGCTASDWTKTPIAPGDRGKVTAAYDPKGRPGRFKKSILVVSNAKSSPNMTIFISGNVIGRPKDFTDTFRVHLGDLLFERNNPIFHQLEADEVRVDTVRFYNNSDKEMQLSVKENPVHITASLSANKIKPAHRGYVVLKYDAARINTSGQRNDRVFLQTNDPKQEVKMLFVTATLKPKPQEQTPQQRFPFQMGNLLLTRNSIVFSEILNSETRTDSVQIYNNSHFPINVEFQKPADHMKPSLSSGVIKPHEFITLKVTYDAAKANRFGFVSGDRIILQTTDTIQPMKVVYISANIREDFSKLTPKQRENAPKAHFENTVFDFGTEKAGGNIQHSFVFSNNGKSDLILRDVKAGCGCTATKPDKTVLKPGESSKIDVNFNTRNRKGNQNNRITVITNDPDNSVIVLQVKGVLEN